MVRPIVITPFIRLEDSKDSLVVVSKRELIMLVQSLPVDQRIAINILDALVYKSERYGQYKYGGHDISKISPQQYVVTPKEKEDSDGKTTV